MIQNVVYLLCLATSLLCAILLARAYVQSRARLLLWGCLCFGFLSLNNLLLVIDLMFFPTTDIAFSAIGFSVLRSAAALIGLLFMVFGLVWESK